MMISRRHGLAAMALLLTQGCVQARLPTAGALNDRFLGPTSDPNFPNIGYAQWEDEPPYRFGIGDKINLSFPYAASLNMSAVVQPDGRAAFPQVGHVRVVGKSVPDLQAELEGLYRTELRRPEVVVGVEAQPFKVFVGGEVASPGEYSFTSDIDALQAVIKAGGARNSANMAQVIIIRRGAGNQPIKRTTDLRNGLVRTSQSDLVPLRTADIVWVPKTGLSSVAAFMGELRGALPVQFSYAINDRLFAN